MKIKSRSILILSIVFGYIFFQFLWWEILLVSQNGKIINEKQKLIELNSSNELNLKKDLAELHQKKIMQTIMIVGEGTVFLILLLIGTYKIKKTLDKENLLNSQQNNFFLSVTHEFKTPIAATKLQLQTLLKQKLSVNSQTELINNALIETERLNNLIDKVLLASSLDFINFNFKLIKINLSDYLHNLIMRYYKTELNDFEIKLELKSNIFCFIDENYFQSVITNLIDNALKYTPIDKLILIELQKNNNKILLKVCDNGPGISDDDKEKVILKFHRIGNEETRKSKGTGLGLYIVNNIINKHGAKFTIKNNFPKGSIFEIQLNEA